MDEIRNKKFLLAQAAADGLGIIMKDSKTSLNKDCYACIRPLYKQRFFTSMIPILVFAIRESGASPSRRFCQVSFKMKRKVEMNF